MPEDHYPRDEDGAGGMAFNDCPEWRPPGDDGSLSAEIVGEDSETMSARSHIAAHAIVEHQLALDEPKGIVAIAQELQALGVTKHEIHHLIALAIAAQLPDLRPDTVFDTGRFLADLRRTVESRRGGRGGQQS